MKVKQTLVAALFLLGPATFLSLPTPVFADGTNPACPAIYGVTCPTGQLFLNKTVQNPATGEFVDTLGSNTVTFMASQTVVFRIEVKNTGSTELTNIQVQDRFPDFVDFVSGIGSFNSNSGVLSWNIDRLGPGESKFFTVNANIRQLSALPQANIFCVTNFAKAQKDNQSAEDTAAFCVQTQFPKKVVARELPKTGLPFAALGLAGLLPVGFKLKKFRQNDQDAEESANYIWQKRKFMRGGE